MYKDYLKAKKVQARHGKGSRHLAKCKLASSSQQAPNSANVNLAPTHQSASRTRSGHPSSSTRQDTDGGDDDPTEEGSEGDEAMSYPMSHPPDPDDEEEMDEETLARFQALIDDMGDGSSQNPAGDEAMSQNPDPDDMDVDGDEQDEQGESDEDLVATLKDLEDQRNGARGKFRGALTEKYRLVFEDAREAGLVVESQYLKLTRNEEPSSPATAPQPSSPPATTRAKAKKAPPAKRGSSSRGKTRMSEEHVHDADELEPVEDEPAGKGKKRKHGKSGGSRTGAKAKKKRVV
jgi:hypothetical protein